MSDLKSAISSQINAASSGHVWVPTDFAHLDNRDAVDKTLQRMVLAGDLRRIDRSLYDKPSINRLTQRSTTPDYRAIVDAIERRDQPRLLLEGTTAANALGLRMPSRLVSPFIQTHDYLFHRLFAMIQLILRKKGST